MSVARSYDMSLTREDFLRLLPAAVGGEFRSEEGNLFLHMEEGRGWRIALSPLPPFALGAITLARQHVEIQLTGYSCAEAEAFLDRFERHFRRGGG
jgi:hypothetical protein